MEDSIREAGFGDSLTVSRDGVILSGNQRAETLADLSMMDAIVVESDGTKPVIHVRTDLVSDDPRARKLALYSNRVGQVNLAWDRDELKQLQADGIDLSKLWGTDELAALLDAEMQPAGRTDPDAVPAERPTDIQRGDLFELGAHRLLCGDSTRADDVERVMAGERPSVVITDPPYNVGFNYGEAVDDEKTQAAYCDWNRGWFGLARALSASCVVLTPGITNLPMWIAEIERTHRIIAWVKENQCSRNYIGTTSGFNVWEPVLVFGKAKKCVPRDSFSIPIHIQADAEGHPCPKSIKAWSWLVENFSDQKDLLYEPFSGSGTTLIACETMGRRCYAIEIEPKFVQIAVDRWEAYTGEKAVKVSESVVAS